MIEIDFFRDWIHLIIRPLYFLAGLTVICMMLVVSLLGAKLVDNTADRDAGNPGFEGSTVIKLIEVTQYFEEREIETGRCILPVFGIPEANAHHVTVAMVVQAKLGLLVTRDTLFDPFGFYLHRGSRKGHRLVIPSQ